MSEDRELSPLRERDYEAIEAAVMETERGRWFLAEYARRNRTADTRLLLDAIRRLERILTAYPVRPMEDAGSHNRHTPPLADPVREAMDAAREDLAEILVALSPGKVWPRTSEEAITILDGRLVQKYRDMEQHLITLRGLHGTLAALAPDVEAVKALNRTIHGLAAILTEERALMEALRRGFQLFRDLDRLVSAARNSAPVTSSGLDPAPQDDHPAPASPSGQTLVGFASSVSDAGTFAIKAEDIRAIDHPITRVHRRVPPPPAPEPNPSVNEPPSRKGGIVIVRKPGTDISPPLDSESPEPGRYPDRPESAADTDAIRQDPQANGNDGF